MLYDLQFEDNMILTLFTEKLTKRKEIIKKHAADFGGTQSDAEVMMFCKDSRCSKLYLLSKNKSANDALIAVKLLQIKIHWNIM